MREKCVGVVLNYTLIVLLILWLAKYLDNSFVKVVFPEQSIPLMPITKDGLLACLSFFELTIEIILLKTALIFSA